MAAEQEYTPFRDPSLPVDTRIDWLLSELTMSEKLAMISSGSADAPRLGFRRMAAGGEAAHGVEARNDQNDLGRAEPTTSFPQPIGMSASWDPEMIRKAGEVTGTEARVLYHRHPDRGLLRWAPTVDMCRDPRWGRNEEGYGEDPVLTGKMASAYIRGMQGEHPRYLRCAATLKHFYANNVEEGRGWKNSTVDPRNRYEYYFEPFRRCIQDGHAEGIMTAYNRINGRVGVLNPEVQEILKDQYGLTHAVSDGGATGMVVSVHHEFGLNAQTIPAAIRAGVDAMSDNPKAMHQGAAEAYELGLLTEKDVNQALRNMLRTKIRLGIYDQPNENPYDKVTEADLCSDRNREICLQLTRESLVLLKNEGDLLPLGEDEDIALIGHVGDKWYQDWYGGEPDHRITLRQGLEKIRGTKVSFSDALDRVKLKFEGRYLTVREDEVLCLDPKGDTFILTDWGEDSITLHCERTGKCLRMYVPFGQFADLSKKGLILADKEEPFDFLELAVFHRRDQEDGTLELHTFFEMPMTVNEDGTVGCDAGKTPLRLTLEKVRDGLEEAVSLARKHQTVILALGSNPVINAKEISDRTTLALPPDQARLLTEVRKANPRVVLMLLTNYPYLMNEAKAHIPAILLSATGSQDLGRACAETIYGINAPAGRLNQTWVLSEDQLPPMDDYDIIQKGRTYRYLEGETAFAFGHGLTYTAFAYSGLKAEVQENSILDISFTVTNTGERASDEVAQVYAVPPPSRVRKPLKQLLGFERLKDVQPGESRQVQLRIPTEELRFYDVISRTLMVEEGEYGLFAGPSSQDRALETRIHVPGGKPGFRDSRKHQPADHFDSCENLEITEGLLGFSAVTPMDPEKPMMAEYRDCCLPGKEGELVLFLKSAAGCRVKACINGIEKACWEGETRTYARNGMRIRRDPKEKLERQKPIFVELRLSLEDLPADSPATLQLCLEGDAQLCYWRVTEPAPLLFG